MTIQLGFRFFRGSIPAGRMWAFSLLIASALTLFAGGAVADGDSLDDLDMRYQALTGAIFEKIALEQRALQEDGARSQFTITTGSTRDLQETVREATEDKRGTRAVAYIAVHLELVLEDASAEQLSFFVQTLLDNHALGLAEKLLERARTQVSDYRLAKVRLAMAQHYAANAEWEKALNELALIDVATVLDEPDAEEANIIYGVSLQGQKRHREAVKYYDRVKPTSVHYPVAQLNTALAYIRQDWWTDAQRAVESALGADPDNKDSLTNRLYTVLGFFQIQYGFYRDARESFRNVHVDSSYANRALLGLGISALYQEDMIGALNAFSHLKSKTADDISVLESYLLSAYALDRLGQISTASANYSEAIAFYEQKVGRLDGLVAGMKNREQEGSAYAALLEQAHNAVSRKHREGLLTLTGKIDILDALLDSNAAQESRPALLNLRERFAAALADQTLKALTERKAVIDSYLSQSQFGLAQLHDAGQ